MKNLTLLVLIILSMNACFTDRIELDLNEDNQRLAVVAWINDLDEPQYITLGKTVNYLGEQEQDFVSDAIVTISDESQNYALEYGSNGQYYMPNDWVAQIGDTYELNISWEGEEYKATQTMNACPPIENAYSESETDSLFNIYFSIQDPEGEGDAYYVTDYKKGSTSGDSLRNGSFANDEFFDGEYLEDISVTESSYILGDTIIVEIQNIGIETAQFLTDIETEVFRGTPFDPPPANVQSNIDNGAVGYFIVSGAQRVALVVGE